MTHEKWLFLCTETAKEHPEWTQATIEAWSDGVFKQAEHNKETVCNLCMALSLLYDNPQDEASRKLARERMLESKLFVGTPYEKRLTEETNQAKG